MVYSRNLCRTDENNIVSLLESSVVTNACSIRPVTTVPQCNRYTHRHGNYRGQRRTADCHLPNGLTQSLRKVMLSDSWMRKVGKKWTTNKVFCITKFAFSQMGSLIYFSNEADLMLFCGGFGTIPLQRRGWKREERCAEAISHPFGV